MISESENKSNKSQPLAPRNPLREFLQTEQASGVLIIAAVIFALFVASSPLGDSWARFWEHPRNLDFAGLEFHLTTVEWINDAVMTFFFLLVGLEIRREIVHGELRDPKKAAIPTIAAIGGMITPALIYLIFNHSGVEQRGWAIPMATDIALALGILSLVKPKAPGQLRVFLLTLAIADDIGAILVIAIVFSSGLNLGALGIAGALVALLWLAREYTATRAGMLLLAVPAVGLWVALHEAGIHPTIAGVIVGLLAPTKPIDSDKTVIIDPDFDPSTPREVAPETGVEWLEHLLHPIVSFLIVPVFAMANAGIKIDATLIKDGLTSPITIGVGLGLVIGKMLGITLFTVVSQRLLKIHRPIGIRDLAGLGAIAGVGFTVSLFLIATSLPHGLEASEAKLGVLLGSLVAAGIGLTILSKRQPSLDELGVKAPVEEI